mgnify:CR=1 FL=1
MTGRTGVSIIVPAYNEGGNVEAALYGVLCAAREALGRDFEIIAVNDGSEDNTGATLDALAGAWPDLTVLHHERNRGLKAAYETGLARATMPFVVWLPGDGEMATPSIAAILRAVGTADLVVPYHGTPERRTWFRRLLTWGSTTQLNLLLGHDLNYYQGTVVYPTAFARRLPRTENGFFFCAEMLAHALDEGLTYVEVPLAHTDRAHGVSKAVSWRAIWRAQLLILRLFYRLRIRPLVDVTRYAANGGL